MQYKVVIKVAKDGNPVPIINGITIHSLYAPIKEGEKIFQCLENFDNKDSDTLVVLGCGLGYHFLPYIDKYRHVYIAESIHEMREMALSFPPMQAFQDKIHWVSNAEEIPILHNFHLVVLNSETRFQPDFFSAIAGRLKNSTPMISYSPSTIRILVVSPIYGGSYTTAQYVYQALTQLEYQVEFFDNAIADSLFQKILESKTHSNDYAEQLTEMLSSMLLEKVQDFQPHLVIFLAQSPISVEVAKAVRSISTTVFWFVEDYRRFQYWKGYACHFDLFATIQKGSFFEELNQNANTNFMYLPMAAASNIQKVNPDDKEKLFWGAPVSFMGAAYPNRVSFFKEMRSFGLKLWGSGWEDYPEFDECNFLKGKRISIEESIKIYKSTLININLHSSMATDYFEKEGDFINPRTFEIMACGAFQLVDHRSLLTELFHPDQEIVIFESVEEAKDKIAFYLREESLRKKIALNGQKKVLTFHTYEHRMQTLLKEISHRLLKFNLSIEQETEQWENLYTNLKDEHLVTLLKTLSVTKRKDFSTILESYKQNPKLTQQEAILHLLESFQTGNL